MVTLKGIRNFDVKSDEYEIEKQVLLKSIESNLFSKNHPSIFPELIRITVEAIVSETSMVLLCDMPELLNRMHLVAKHSLDEFLDIFNNIMRKMEDC